MEISQREPEYRRQFDGYSESKGKYSTPLPAVGPYRCPCCGCRTLDARCHYDICPVCFWEDDGQDDVDAGVVRGGPNGALSLEQARENYLRLGACEEDMLPNVRPPLPNEMP